jgi:hypothetical protein
MSTKTESISQDTFSLKGQCHEIFLLLIFFVNHLPLIIIASGSFLEFFRKFAEIFAIQGAQLVSTVPLSGKILPTLLTFMWKAVRCSMAATLLLLLSRTAYSAV